jgi:HPt (histidine-containing phosphotransfer) domain-containing protein
MMRDVDFIVLPGPLGWSDEFDSAPAPIELDGAMIDDLRTYREGLFESMIGLFEDQTPMRIDSIRTALDGSDAENLRHQAHELAGGAAYVGAGCLARHARAIESLARLHDFERAAALAATLEEHAERTLAALRAVLAEPKGDVNP